MNTGISLKQLRKEAGYLLQGAPPGAPLPPLTVALIQYAMRVSVPVLDVHAAQPFAIECLDRGATIEQLHEVLTLVAGLGVHSLMEGSQSLYKLAQQRGIEPDVEPDEAMRLLEGWTRGASYWENFNASVPGFLKAISQISPSALDGFMMIGALPGKTNSLPVLTKEIISISVDSLPSHRYMPGLVLHIRNALKLGAGDEEILSAIDLASEAPAHLGVQFKGDLG